MIIMTENPHALWQSWYDQRRNVGALEQKLRITKVWICTVFRLYSFILASQLLQL